jgi:RimJ/RimL family protein N-acetyltransferase
VSVTIRRPLSIRPPRPEDAGPLYEAIHESRAELSTWMSWCHAGYGPEDAASWIERSIAAAASASEHNFLVLDAGAQILGTCALNQVRPENRLANLGYWVRSSAAGWGIAPEAVSLVADYAFRETDFVRLEIVVAVDNARSRRVAEKAGAIFECVARDRIFIHGAQVDAAMYVLLRSARRSEAEA